jgi:hypothetical protein
MTPLFLGSGPAEVKITRYAGIRVLSKEEDYGMKLINAFTDEQKTAATLSRDVPNDILTNPSSSQRLTEYWEIKGSELNTNQKELLRRLISEYIKNPEHEKSHYYLNKIERSGIDEIYFAWIGSYQRLQPHYYVVSVRKLKKQVFWYCYVIFFSFGRPESKRLYFPNLPSDALQASSGVQIPPKECLWQNPKSSNFLLMRSRFEAQMTLGCTPIGQVDIPAKTRAHIAALMQALQYIYTHPEWNQRIFALLPEKVSAGKKPAGRRGMSLWEIFVLGRVRLCLNTSCDELHYRANYDTLLRGVLGVLPTDFSTGKQYEYQNIYDNVKLLDEQLPREINDVIVEAGHQVFKKKEAGALRLKTDSFVVETDVRFPADYNLLWDSARKCIDIAEKLPVPGWRKSKH